MMSTDAVKNQGTGETLFQRHAEAIAGVLEKNQDGGAAVLIDTGTDKHPFPTATEALETYRKSKKDFDACRVFITALAICDKKAIITPTLFKTSGTGTMMDFSKQQMFKLSGAYGDYLYLMRRYSGLDSGIFEQALAASFSKKLSYRVRLDGDSFDSSVVNIVPLQTALNDFYKALHTYRCNPPQGDPQKGDVLQWITEHGVPDPDKETTRKPFERKTDNNLFKFILLCAAIGAISTALWVHQELTGR